MPKKQNLGLISVLKILFSNPESDNDKWKAKDERKTFYNGIRNALFINNIPGVRFAYARILANILADLAIVIGAALIIAAIVMTSFPVPVLPALMVIGLMMIAAATVTRAITSLIHKFDKNELRPYNWIGNTLVIASAGLMIASIFFPPLLLPLLIGAGIALSLGAGTLIYESYNKTDDEDSAETRNSANTTASTVNMLRNMPGNGKASGEDVENRSQRSSSSGTEFSVSSSDYLYSNESVSSSDEDLENPSRSSSVSSLDSNESENKTWRTVRPESTDSDNSIEPKGFIQKKY